jgi:hypothetical protein
MRADYLSRLPGTEPSTTLDTVTTFNQFQMDLYDLQMTDAMLQMVQQYMTTNKWPPHLSKVDRNYLQIFLQRLYQDKNISSG